MTTRKASNRYFLAPDVTVARYQELLETEPLNRPAIADMVRRRFESRFIEPVCDDGKVRGGFAALALCCLAVETLQSFRSGKSESGNTAAAIEAFIRYNPEFANLLGQEYDFYVNIRNALLHQAQTAGGWRINLSGPVFNSTSLSIGAQKFVEGFRAALARYCAELEQTNNDSPLWKSLLRKMDAIIEACDAEGGYK
jgi:hypothetical protein